MIGWLTRHRMALAFSLAAALLLAIGVVAFSARRLVERHETVRYITRVLSALDGVLSAVTDAEMDQRRFLMTGDERYLAPYAAAIGSVDGSWKELRAVTVGEVRRQPELDALATLVAETVAELRETERLRREQGLDAARRRFGTGRSLYLTEQMWTMVNSMKVEDRRRLTEESDRHAKQARQVFVLLTTLAGATIVVLMGLIVESRWRTGEIRTTREALRTQVAEHQETASLLTALVQSSDDAIIGLGLDGRILTWNAGAQRLYGFGQDEARGQSIDLLLPRAPEAGSAAILERVQRERAIERLETQHVTKDGRSLHVVLTIAPIRDLHDGLVGISVVGRDVGAQKQAEEALRRSEATSRAFLESAAEGIIAADAAGRIVFVNDRTEAMFGYTRPELIGQPVELLIPRRVRHAHEQHRGAYMAAPRARSMGKGLELAGLKKDGTEFPVEVSLSYVQSADEGTFAIAFVIDISERLAFQRAARQADKLAAVGTLAAGIAHEINNPIGIISSRVEVMLLEGEGGQLPAELRKDLDVILRHARRVATITQGLLSFARRSPGTRETVNLNRIVEEILQLAQKDMSRASIRLVLKLQEGLPDITADANAIGQVMLNLLTNARRSITNEGEITIETGYLSESRSVRLLVRDTGSGIPPEILPKIFDPFFTTKPDGTGLGLSISHGIVHDHRGTLDVQSQLGGGTTFTVTFPLDGDAGA